MQLDAWSRDGKWLYFSSNSREADSGASDVWRVAAARRHADAGHGRAGDVRILRRAVARRQVASRSSARGFANGQWWRHGRSHMDESQLALVDVRASLHARSPPTARKSSGRCGRPTASGSSSCPIAAAARTSGRLADRRTSRSRSRISPTAALLWPSICVRRKDDRLRARLRDLEGSTPRAAAPRDGRRSALRQASPSSPADRASQAHRSLQRLGALARRQEGRVHRARRGLRGARRKKPATRCASRTPRRSRSQPAWSSDSKSIVYVSDRDGTHAPLPLRLRDRERDAAHLRRRHRRHAALLARRQADRVQRNQQRPRGPRPRHEPDAHRRERPLRSRRRSSATAPFDWSPDSNGSPTSTYGDERASATPGSFRLAGGDAARRSRSSRTPTPTRSPGAATASSC